MIRCISLHQEYDPALLQSPVKCQFLLKRSSHFYKMNQIVLKHLFKIKMKICVCLRHLYQRQAVWLSSHKVKFTLGKNQSCVHVGPSVCRYFWKIRKFFRFERPIAVTLCVFVWTMTVSIEASEKLPFVLILRKHLSD